MSYQTYVSKDMPYLFASADAIAGGRVVAPLVRGIGTASAIETGDTATFAFPGFTQFRRDQSFALECWFLPLGGSATILGHAEGDGILWDGSKIVFRLKLIDENVDVTYTPDQTQTFHVVAQYSRGTMTLYVNGEMVNYYTLTTTQYAKAWASLASQNTIVSAGNHVLDAVAFYTRDVDSKMPKDHYNNGRVETSLSVLTASLGGAFYEHANFQPLIDYTWDYTNWNWQEFAGLGMNSLLYPTVIDAFWRDVIIIDDTPDVVYLDYDARDGAVVEYSTDGTTWNAAARLTPLTFTAPGDLAVRVRFPTLTGTVGWIRVVAAKDSYLAETQMERPVEVTFAANPELFYPIENKRFAGARGTATIQPSASTTTRSVEFWVRPDAASTVGSFTTFTGTTYVNGVAGSTLPAGEWAHVVVVAGANENGSRTVGGTGRWAGLTLYSTALTSGDVTTLYNSYFGKDIQRFTVNAFITLPQPTVQSYDYTWTPAATV